MVMLKQTRGVNGKEDYCELVPLLKVEIQMIQISFITLKY